MDGDDLIIMITIYILMINDGIDKFDLDNQMMQDIEGRSQLHFVYLRVLNCFMLVASANLEI